MLSRHPRSAASVLLSNADGLGLRLQRSGTGLQQAAEVALQEQPVGAATQPTQRAHVIEHVLHHRNPIAAGGDVVAIKRKEEYLKVRGPEAVWKGLPS